MNIKKLILWMVIVVVVVIVLGVFLFFLGLSGLAH